MANKNIDALVYCPFYITEARNSITCEGIIGEKTVSRFERESDKVYHQFNFCTGKTCTGCPVFKGVMGNYTPEEREATLNVIDLRGTTNPKIL